MSREFIRPPAVAGCRFLILGCALVLGCGLVLGCATSNGASGGTGGGGTGGGAGAGGEGGRGAEVCNVGFCIDNEPLRGVCEQEYDTCIDRGGAPETCQVDAEETCVAPELAGLWVGESSGIGTCLFISQDGTQLTRSTDCNIEGTSTSSSNSFDLDVETIGRDGNGEPCSFTLSYQQDVEIDPNTGAFGAIFTDAGAEFAFSGALRGLTASGVATRAEGESTCTVGWGASRAVICDDAAINACLDLLDCCRAILVNPVFFQACDQVALECNEARCRQVLAGYPQCDQLDL